MGKYKFDVYYSHRVRFTYLSNYAIIDLESIRKMLWPVSDRALARADKCRLETGLSEFLDRHLNLDPWTAYQMPHDDHPNPMLLRAATLADLDACISLNADSQTDHVWQMEEREENGGILVRFQTVRLPRAMHVTYPRRRDDLASCWESGSFVLVTSDKPAVAEREQGGSLSQEEELPRVYAYCQLDALAWQGTGWISHLIVDRPHRRTGIGAAMLRAGILWGRNRGLKRLMAAVQTKNYPGIRFCQKFGFVFSGFNDHYYPNRDIALFFSLRI